MDSLIVKQHFSEGPSCFCRAESENNLETWGNCHPSSCNTLNGTSSPVQRGNWEHLPGLNPSSLILRFWSYSWCCVNADYGLAALTNRAVYCLVSVGLCRCWHRLPGWHLLRPLLLPKPQQQGLSRASACKQRMQRGRRGKVMTLPGCLCCCKQSQKPWVCQRCITFYRTTVSAFRRNLCWTNMKYP